MWNHQQPGIETEADTLSQQYLDADALAKTIASYNGFENRNFINFDNVIESPTQTTGSSGNSSSNSNDSSTSSADSSAGLLLQAAQAHPWTDGIGSVNPWQLSQPTGSAPVITALGDSAECVDDLESVNDSNTSTSHSSPRTISLSMSPPYRRARMDSGPVNQDITRTTKTRRASASDSTSKSNSSRKRKQSMEDRLERNRVAATKWRKKKKDNLERLQHDYANVKAENLKLKKSVESYREEVIDLKLRMIADHGNHNGQGHNPLV